MAEMQRADIVPLAMHLYNKRKARMDKDAESDPLGGVFRRDMVDWFELDNDVIAYYKLVALDVLSYLTDEE